MVWACNVSALLPSVNVSNSDPVAVVSLWDATECSSECIVWKSTIYFLKKDLVALGNLSTTEITGSIIVVPVALTGLITTTSPFVSA